MTRTVASSGNTAAERHAPPRRWGDPLPGLHRRPGKPRPVEPGSWRDRLRHQPAPAPVHRVAVFTAGLLLVLVGLALTGLPGPLTIPPVLAGLWVRSTESDRARRFFATFRRTAVEAWRHAGQHPVSPAAVTLGGLAAAGAVLWAVGYFDAVERDRSALGT